MARKTTERIEDSVSLDFLDGDYLDLNVEIRYEPVNDLAFTTAFVSKKSLRGYRVWIGSVAVGRVIQKEGHRYRLSGQIRYGDSYPIQWDFSLDPDATMADYHHGVAWSTRRAATTELLVRAVRDGRLDREVAEGKRQA